jgi:hypothetical protein
MTPVVDIIGAVVTAMKPTISASAAIIFGTTVTVNDLSKSVTDKLFVGQRMKCTFSTSVIYGVIATISDTVITITVDTSSKVAPTAISVVLNYHYGHLLEIKNIFQQATAKASLKLEQFPAIVLVQDFPEVTDRKKHLREATLRVIILTDSKQSYIASDRYTYIFEPKLYPLEDLFFKCLERSNEISGYDQGFTRWDRLFWGRTQGEGTASNIFNDYIDAIELENLKIKILNTC